jgi:thioredoxin-like negative regulator of GroEL
MDPSRLFTSHTLCKLLLATGRTDEAARVLEPVVAGLPDDLDVRLTLIRLRMKQNRLEEAATLISDLLDKDDLLPRPIHDQLQPLAAQLSKKLSN